MLASANDLNYGGGIDGIGVTSGQEIPVACTHTTFSFWLHIDTAEATTTTAFDKLTITANGTTIATFSNLNHNTGYAQHSYSLGSFAGQTVTLKFTGTEDSSLQTSFALTTRRSTPADPGYRPVRRSLVARALRGTATSWSYPNAPDCSRRPQTT